ncbi:hypothetical protein [Rahnella sp. R3(2024)]|uniref:RipA family octameric membrane protein n=1 Tax=Rahnella sp. R3(2024) TaxID=3163550 RepID=UPI0036ED2FFC
MCDSENSFKPIPIEPSHQKYLNYLLKSEINNSENITHLDKQQYEKVVKALDKAHDIRKFEIDFYWKRATYFWAFITIVATAYSAYFYSSKSEEHILPLLFLSLLGFILSVCFYASTISSKSWQNNWEKSVDVLEYYVTGNLYKVNIDNGDLFKYSVSKINNFISSIICLSWCFAFIYPTIKDSLLINNFITHNLNCTLLIICSLLLIWGVVVFMIRKGTKDEERENKIKPRNLNIEN